VLVCTIRGWRTRDDDPLPERASSGKHELGAGNTLSRFTARIACHFHRRVVSRLSESVVAAVVNQSPIARMPRRFRGSADPSGFVGYIQQDGAMRPLAAAPPLTRRNGAECLGKPILRAIREDLRSRPPRRKAPQSRDLFPRPRLSRAQFLLKRRPLWAQPAADRAVQS